MKNTARQQQIQEQLKSVGVSGYGRMKAESQHLVDILHIDEQIKGVVYGRYSVGSAMLIATDKRVIFYDRMPLFQTVDELTYDVIVGVNLAKAGPLSTLILHTRAGDYTLRYVNLKTAGIFKQYLEQNIIEVSQRTSTDEIQPEYSPVKSVELDKTAQAFLESHHVGVLSTIEKNGQLHGAAIFYQALPKGELVMLTKASASKARNVVDHPLVALTVFDPETMQTIQLQGQIEVETDKQKKKAAFASIIENHKHGRSDLLPIFKLPGDDFLVLKIAITSAKYSDFS